MLYEDKVYGTVKIDDELILALINNPVLQRLKKIDQAGYSKPFFPGKPRNRFEHSVGVFILLKKFCASNEEQIAGLLHDISHLTFSHCIDYALGKGTEISQSHQDNIFIKFFKDSDVSQILKNHGIDPNYILDEENFHLKERKLPDLCADRIDYTLRDALGLGEKNKEFTNKVISNLSVENNTWVFKDFQSARTYAEFFKQMNEVYYSGLSSALMFQTVGDFLKHSVKKRYINKKDFYKTDDEVLEKIIPYLKIDQKLKVLWQRMNNKVKIKINSKNFDTHVFCKSRTVDPLFKEGNKIVRLSDYYPRWKDVLKKESDPKEYFIKFEA